MITIYGSSSCKHCVSAVNLVEAKCIPYAYVDVVENEEAREYLKHQGFRTIPQCYEDGKHIGGFTQLQEYITHVRKD